MSIIQLENIDFSYKKNEPILSKVNLTVPEGSIYGFLGANGAGKSTTIRLMLGLMKPKSGSVSLFGKDIKETYPKHLAKVGSLIESASLYGHLSAKDHLRIAGKYFNIKTDMDKILEKVKLGHTGKKKIKNFSTGMKQRLGLALALQHDPNILILDEPTNGLDPNGIIELRGIIKELNQDGKTILLSSHILSEVEKIVTQLGILKNGSIVFEGSIDELKSKGSKNVSFRFQVSEIEKITSLLSQYQPSISGDHEFDITVEDKLVLPQVIRTLVENQIDIFEVTPNKGELENMFLDLTNPNLA